MPSLTSLTSQIITLVNKTAIACHPYIGKGDNHMADQAAVVAMREGLNNMPISGEVVIGEGERDEAPMLYIGEKVGLGGEKVDIALDPLEGTTICANMAESSLVVVAFASKGINNEGGFLHAPDVYMQKIAVGPNLPKNIIDLEDSVANNLKNIALAKKCSTSDLVVMILDRPRHQEIIAKTREAGAKIRLITDGDVAGVIACANPNYGIDCYLGTGGAPEGVLAAAALQVVGGQMMGKLIFDNNQNQINRAKQMGISDLNFQYTASQMARGHIIFACAGVTNGYMLSGVKENKKGHFTVNSLLLNSQTKEIINTKTKYLSC
ncbi:MAG: class II fructose-bisphosphatase [Proteobacteria bacterium]|nr:class II fructose-bisphosphatase [Pseudomonadota bacterium]